MEHFGQYGAYLGAYLWPFLALITAIVSCGTLIVTQIYKTPAFYLLFWCRVFMLLCCLPLFLFIAPPTSLVFYGLVSLTGVLSIYADFLLFTTTSKIGGGPVARTMPLIIFVTFILWLVIEPSQIIDFIDTPLKTAMILSTLLGCMYFASNMRHCAVSFETLKTMAPAILLYGINIVIAKYAFTYAEFHSGALYYLVVQSISLLITLCLWSTFNQKSPHSLKITKLINKDIMRPGAYVAFFIALNMASRNYANILTPNPAYVVAIAMTTPVWMIVVYKMMGYKDDADIKSGLGLMFCAICLALITV